MADQRRGSRVLAIILGVFAVIGLVASVTAWWVHQTVLDTDTWVATVTDIVEDEDIIEALSETVGEQVVVVLDLNTRIDSALPEELKFLVVPISAWADSFIRDQAAAVARSDLVRVVWVEANRLAHSSAVALIRGDLGPVVVEGGQVVLDLTGLANETIRLVQEAAGELLGSDLAVAVAEWSLSEERITELEARLGAELADDFGRIVVFSSDELEALQALARVLDLAAFVLPVLTILLFAGAWRAAPDRRAGGIWLMAGAAVGLLAAWLAVGGLQATLVDAIAEEGRRPAVESVIAPFVGRLRSWMFILLVVLTGGTVWWSWFSDRSSGTEAQLAEPVEDDADVAQEPPV